MATESPRYELSRAGRNIPSSLMSELAEVIMRPGMISFATGLPPSGMLPTEALRRCAQRVIKRDGPLALQYGPPYPPLTEWIAEYMRGRGVDCEAENVFITNGAQQALDLLSQLFLDPEDVAVLERVTYMGFWQIALKRAVPRTVGTDLRHGIDMKSLERAFAEEPSPRMAFLIADFHNPLGVSLSEAQRKRVASLAAEHQVLIIEDDTYSLLRVEGEAPPPIKAFDQDGWVLYCASLSKIVAPAMRMGWAIVPTELLPKMYSMRESLDLQSSALTQRIVAEFLTEADFHTYLGQYRNLLRERRDTMLAGLKSYFSDLGSWTRPDGGFFVWLELPPELNSMTLLQEAVERQVAFVPGTAFTAGDDARNALRLSYSNVTSAQIEEGLPRLAGAVRAALKKAG